MEYSEILIRRIRALCEKRKISINGLASMSNISQSTLDNIMQGNTTNPGIQTIHKIANGFSMTVAEFLNFNDLNDYSFDDKEENE